MTDEQDKLLALLVDCQNGTSDDGCLTTMEVAEQMGITVDTAREYIKILIRRGTVECHKTVRVNMAGTMQPIPGYRLVV